MRSLLTLKVSDARFPTGTRRLLAVAYQEKIADQHRMVPGYPAYDFEEGFPKETQPMSESEREQWLKNFDLEDFEGLDKNKFSNP